MDNYEEYLKEGASMLYDGILKGILEIKNKAIRNAMLGFWSGELTFEEHVKAIENDFSKRIENEINRFMFEELSNKEKFRVYINKIAK